MCKSGKSTIFKKNYLRMKFSKVVYGVPGGSRGAPGGVPGGPGELFGGPEATLRSRGATLEGPGVLFGASKNGPRVFF